jgi:nicotinate-nucleotide pyrophosphorylase
MMANISDLKKIKKAVDNMSLDSLKHIYNIIINNNQPITKKSDCFLINLGNLNKDTIEEIIKFIDFIDSNTIILEQDEKIKHDYAEEIKHFSESYNQ